MMRFFLVTMVHPDGNGWDTHLAAHVAFLRQLVEDGTLYASGPLKGTDHRSGFLILRAEDRAGAEAIVAADPFAIEDLIIDLTILEWDPLFGALSSESSGMLAGQDMRASE